VLRGVRAAGGDAAAFVIDNRQLNHEWGPWM